MAELHSLQPHAHVHELEPLTLRELQEARARIGGRGPIATPLVRLSPALNPPGTEIWLKLETLQPIGSFKLRGAVNAILSAPREELQPGGHVWTASTGNMAQGVAYACRDLGYACTVAMPDNAPEAKLQATVALGAAIVKVPRAEWFDFVIRGTPLSDEVRPPGFFVHPCSDRAVMAGQGTVALEVLEQLPELDAIVTPYGGGGLTGGVASGVKLLKPSARAFACELETGAPLAPSLAAGHPVSIAPREAPAHAEGFSGAPSVIHKVWPVMRDNLDGSLLMSVAELEENIAALAAEQHLVVEGAGAAAVAVARAGKAGKGKIVCVVSGGHIDMPTLARILTRLEEEELLLVRAFFRPPHLVDLRGFT